MLCFTVFLSFQVTLRPYVVKDITVTPTPRAGSSKWNILIPAIIVPTVVVLFLILAFTWAKCAAKRKRERLKVKPHDKVQNSKVSFECCPYLQ